jgi:N-methylhydantoinase A
VVGAQALARTIGTENVITFDMGGTTAKAAIIERGALTRALEYQVGGGIMTGSRLLTGAGNQLKVPAIDLAEVGAGGGSIVRIDAGGAMTVGPESAGAMPGPVCYANGGTLPTITDANLILGYLNPGYLVGGELKLDAGLAREAFEHQVARPLGLSLEHAAYGAHRIASANMIVGPRARLRAVPSPCPADETRGSRRCATPCVWCRRTARRAGRRHSSAPQRLAKPRRLP